MLDFASFLSDNQDKKNPLLVSSSQFQHPTGLMHMDYGCGSWATVYDEDEMPIFAYHNIGITAGSVNVIISRSQGGKSTLATQMGMAIIEPFVNGFLYQAAVKETYGPKEKIPESKGYPFIQILDTEGTASDTYVKKLTHYNNKLLKQCVTINQITTDKDLIKAVEKHVAYKVANMTKVHMPMLDIYGKPIINYPPTVIVIDSASQLLLDDVDDPNKIGGKDGMTAAYEAAIKGPAGALRAKVISAMYSQLVNYAKRYNIIIFSINHINKMPAIMGIPVKQYRGLRAGETIGGGERAIYLAANILRLDVIKNVGGASSSSVQLGEGITGHVAIASWIKCKSNSKSNSSQIVYTNLSGYDPLLSSLWFDKETGKLAKSGNNFFINKYPEYKFNLKNYTEVFGEHPELFTGYYDQLRAQCEDLLDNPDDAVKNNRKLMETIRDDIHDDDNISKGDADDMDDMFASLMNE